MTIGQSLKVAWEGITMNKVRSFLTTLGVIIGVAAVIMMMAISAGAEAEVADQINALGANLIMVMQARMPGAPGRSMRSTLVYDDLLAIDTYVTGIRGVSAEQPTTQDIYGGGVLLEEITILGVTPGFPSVREYEVTSGRFFTQEETDRAARVAVLGHDIAQDLLGDQSPLGQTIKIGSTDFIVIGVMEEKGAVGNIDFDSQIYIPITVVFKRFSPSRLGGDPVRVIYVSAESREGMDDVMAQITTLLCQRHDVDPSSPDFTFLTQDTIIEAQTATTETFRDLLAWVASISLLVGGIGIMNIMLVSVTERTKEIGLRQAVGARPWNVQMQFLLEAVTLSLLGGLIGVLGGIVGAYLMNATGSMRTELVPTSIPLAFAAAAAVGIFFGYYPAARAARLDPIEALRHE